MPYGTSGCARCILADRLDDLLTGPDGTVPMAIRPIATVLAAAEQPTQVLQWLSSSPSATLLSRLAADGRPVTHELLDTLAFGRAEYNLRTLLVHIGVLPERNEDIERIPAWLEHVLDGRPADHGSLMRPFVNWHLLRRGRRRAQIRRYPAQAGPMLRARVRIALMLLDWLDETHTPLAGLSQDRLDRWLCERGPHCYDIRYFLNWAAGRGLADALTVPAVPRQDAVRLIDEDTQWRTLQRCLSDTSMPIDVRAAGALVLLFGLPVSRLRFLTADHLQTDSARATLLFGRKPLTIPPQLAALLTELAGSPPNRISQLGATGPGARWLFCGVQPGQPMSTNGLQRRLNAYGIAIRSSRNTALIALAADLPAPILADVVGMHPGTAVRWARLAQRDGSDYLADRTGNEARRRQAESTRRPARS